MFDRIHRRYDLLNHLFSFGQDIIWRYKLSQGIEKKDNQQLLDLATGTGDVAFSLLKHSPRIKHAHACDMAQKMLQLARKKAIKKKLSPKVSLLQGDAINIPYVNDIFDVVTMAFGIRNVTNPSLVLTEIFRVLKTGGKAFILEFSLPANKILRKLHLFYLRHIIPRVGAVISRDKHAYRYLNKTIETFPYGQSFCQLMQTAGFRNVRFKPLTFGVVTIYQGEK
ncbi:MAG: bifunctional demethylmenaquinone methyltransferase/2-methoxy-6-polyprenyl-1,4-benzoquinol methylase UbiE [Candidatus Aminicenantes bacterium]|nr:bifunctional demethylmenaquinone methyltransferase/2-methoxy-6-polyprenyl-1,4-benzoquinol methylase UbiE [Candidatus Aminicenantes bacterium]NIM81835.1 bifunctional demethylmenaquinone methyltransferase/2-methoxy-6-polyprenyl-1,4-benzoquinol methylase UbiE [Candidatus Aminicenantes bacterium]NIN21208.1 bifunctional demethylmenaquinone methyltransferase/2-methoxy-6-polyprenyl-1,4-benzoquinol methylase UbiE [Candidatus Aminicenantes bacterium]NIN45032.1 bifunctional demethylmenaquinone methyltr